MNYTAFYALFLFVAIAFAATWILPKKYSWVGLLGVSGAFCALAKKGAFLWLCLSVALFYLCALLQQKVALAAKQKAKNLEKEPGKLVKARAKKMRRAI